MQQVRGVDGRGPKLRLMDCPGLDLAMYHPDTMIAHGEGKEACTLGQNRDKDQYPVLRREAEETEEMEQVDRMSRLGHV
jgi:hypothetical protein